MSLRTKLIISFSVLVLGLLCLFGVILAFYLYDHERNQVLHSLYSQIEMADASYDGFERGLKVRVLAVASDRYVIEKTGELLRGQGEKKAILAAELSRYFKQTISLDPTILMVEVLDKDGVVVASSRPERIGEHEKGERNRFTEAIQSAGNDVFLENVVFEEDEDPERPMSHATTRLFSSLSSSQAAVPLPAVLFFHFNNADQLISTITGTNTETKDAKSGGFLRDYHSSDIYLVNSDHLMMTPSRFVKDAVLKQRVDTAPVKACFENNTDFTGEYISYLGKRVWGVGECVDDGRNVLVLEVERQEIMLFIKHIYLQLAALVALMIVLGSISVFFLSTYFLRDLTALTDAIKHIADGKDFSTRIDTLSSGEIGVVGRSLNYLLESLDAFQKKVIESEAILKASNASLERKTAELGKMNEFMVGRELKMIELKKEIERLGGKGFESAE